MSATVEVEVGDRWDALALYERLIPYHSYLIRYGHERWGVNASAPGWHEEELPGALDEIERCLIRRGIPAARVRVDSVPYVMRSERVCEQPAP